MRKINILRENNEFSKIIKNNRGIKTQLFIVYIDKNYEGIYKFGLSVGKKIGNAVIRNKVKRQLKALIDQNDYQNNFKCIIIVRKSFLNCTYLEKEQELTNLFQNLKIIKEIANEK